MGDLVRTIIFLLIASLTSVTAHSQGLPEDGVSETSMFFQLHLQHMFIGSSLILALMCLAWARALRSYSMAILALFFAIKSLSVLVAGGVSLLILFTDNNYFLKVESILLANTANIILLAFTIKFFALKTHGKNSYQLLVCLALAMLMTIPLGAFIETINNRYLISILLTICLVSLLYVTVKVPKSKDRLTDIFSMILLVQLCFNISAYFLFYRDYSIQVLNIVDIVAYWFMAVMVAYLMGRRFYFHIQDEKLAQQQVLKSLQTSDLAQQKLTALQQESQEQLESRVQERTLELNIALQELEEVNQELKEKTTLDELSGLYNRRYYDQKILAEFRRSRRNLTPLSLVMVDIDHFKNVNDNYGHLIGDKFIVEVAKMIMSLLRRSTDVGCRYGGEEFCLILPETDEKGALALAEEICDSMRQQSIIINDMAIKLTVSCGVTTYQQEKDVTPEIIFESVDKALYKAKQAGRDQVQVGLLSEI